MNELIAQKDLSVAQAAELLDVSEPTVYRMVDAKELDYWRKTMRKGIRIYTSSVLNYIKTVQRREFGNGSKKK